MPLFENPNPRTAEDRYHWLDDADVDGFMHLLPPGCTQVPDDEVQANLNPPPTHDQRLYDLTTSYEQAISEDLLFTPSLSTEYYFQVDKKSIEELNSTIQQCTSKKLPDNFYWVSKDNTKVPVTYEDLTGLVEAYFIRKTVEFNKYQARKAALKKEFNG